MRPGHRILQMIPQKDLGRALSHLSTQSQWSLFFSPMSVVIFVVSDGSFLHFELKADFRMLLEKH